MTSRSRNILHDLISDKRWDDAMARMKTEEGKEELRRKGGEYDALPLHWACERGAPLELVEAMVKAYPEAVKVTDSNGELPLHEACYGVSSTQVVRLLLDSYPEGAKATDYEGELPLHCAACVGAPLEVLVMLVDAHPEGVATRDNNGDLPLHYLAQRDSPDEKEDVEKVEVLFRPLLDNEEACLFPNPESGETPLHVAARFDLLRLHTCLKLPRSPAQVIVKVTGRHPGQLRERDESGNLPLHVASANPILNGAQVEFEDLISTLVLLYPEAAAASNGEGRLTLVLAIESGKRWNEGVKDIADAAKHVIKVKDETTGLFPFMLAATVDDSCIDTVYSLFRRCPELKRYALN